MLSYLDPVIFPDECEILEIIPRTRYVYPIYKNGSTSLYETGFPILNRESFIDLSVVDVFIRSPWPRFISGVQTYLRYLKHQDPNIDARTVMKMISECTFLNRHFSLQFHWLCNLSRFYRGNLKLLPIADLSNITHIQINHKTPDIELIEYFVKSEKINFYLQLDKIIHDFLLGHIVTFSDVLTEIKFRNPDLYREVITYSKNICSVLD